MAHRRGQRERVKRRGRSKDTDKEGARGDVAAAGAVREGSWDAGSFLQVLRSAKPLSYSQPSHAPSPLPERPSRPCLLDSRPLAHGRVEGLTFPTGLLPLPG